MGDVAARTVPQEFDLRPEDVVIDERFARMWTGDEEQEAQEIERLASSIKASGQKYPALVIPGKNGSYILIDGHRRRRAILLVNESQTQAADELVKLRVRLELGEDPQRTAATVNIARRGFGPMELALRAQRLREEKHWSGFKGAKKIGSYLGVDPATVTQYEKFLNVGPDTQQQLGDGMISAQSVLAMLKADVSEEEQPRLLKRAAEIQKATDEKASPRTRQRRQVQAARTGKAKQRIEAPAVKRAIREVKGDSGAKITLTRRELLDSIEAFDGPEYGHSNGQVRMWVQYFVDMFAAGKGSVSQMRKRFGAMVSKASKGTKAEEPKVAVKVVKKVVKKASKKKAVKKTVKAAPIAAVVKPKAKAAKRKK